MPLYICMHQYRQTYVELQMKLYFDMFREICLIVKELSSSASWQTV